MKSTVKAIIAGVIIIGIGLSVVLLAGFLNDWDFTGVQWETKTYEFDNALVEDIDLSFAAGTLTIEYYDEPNVKVDYPTSSKFTTTFTTKNSKLYITTTEKTWFGTILWFTKIPAITIYLPRDKQWNLDIKIDAGTVTLSEGNYGDVNVELNAGSVKLGDAVCDNFKIKVNAGSANINGITCNKFKSSVSAGALKVSSLACDDIYLGVSAGSAKLSLVDNINNYTIKVDVSAGSCNVSNQVRGDKMLTIDVSAGSANVLFEK